MTGSKSYMKCMCAISINVTGFIGEVRDSPLVHKPGTKALCFLEDNECAKEDQGQGSYPGGLLCSLSHSTQEMFASCKEAVI